MVVARKLEEIYGDALEQVNEEHKSEKKGFRTVVLFFSFDIVNSSAYKDINNLGWQEVLTSLLLSIQKDVAKEIPEAQLWRVLGDEIIFFVTIRESEEIYSSINAIYNVLAMSNSKLNSGTFLKEAQETNYNDADYIGCNKILAIQAAAWIAIVVNGSKTSINMYDNVFIKYNINENNLINEFLGQDIDAGFRIKKETQSRRLVVSLELAKILSEKTEYLARLYIITYKPLKGVWGNRLYPIIWYHDTEISGGVTFEESFYYDETTYSELSKEYFTNRESEDGNLTSYMFLDVNRAINKVIKDQQLENKMQKIQDIICETKSDVKVVENEFGNKLLEFHCAAVCCDVEKKRVLIAKRKNRKIYSELWEFGCAKANIEQSLCEAISIDYKQDFGIDIELVCDRNREDKEPLPIALYQVEKAEKLQKGVIVMAKVIGNIDKIDEVIQVRQKHERYKWISEEEIEDFNELAINDFKDTLRKVFSLWDYYFGE